MRAHSWGGTWGAIGTAAGGSAAALLLASCGGGGGGSSSDPAIDSGALVVLTGSAGRVSRTIAEANADAGATPLPTLPGTVTTTNHWIRLEFPVNVKRTDVLENSVLTAPFSYLNGAITVSDLHGGHLPGLAMVNGIDALGVDHKNDPDFPHDVQGGVDLNLGKNVFLYVADGDRNLSTFATFGYDLNTTTNQREEIQSASLHENGPLDAVRITVAAIHGNQYDAVWVAPVGAASDTRRPVVVRVEAEERNPNDLGNPASAAIGSSFIVEFSEPVVPRSVGLSPAIDGIGFTGNVPGVPRLLAGVPNLPFPNSGITSVLNPTLGTLFIPFDCRPVNSNNLATYRFRPVISLPPDATVDLLVRSLTLNTNTVTSIGAAVTDLSGNQFDGQDADGDDVPDGTDFTVTFATGPGAGLVNIPVSPEVVYWLPDGEGIGALDLNGRGFTTNTPGALADQRDRAAIVTKLWVTPNPPPLCELNPGGLNQANGQGVIGYPGNELTPLDQCTNAAMLEFGHNRFYYPVGLGSFDYGQAANAARGEPWFAPNDPGNPGTPMPGVNEGSSGFETLCRDSNGDVVLTGRQFGSVGQVNDLIVGQFLDQIYFDQNNLFVSPGLHVSFMFGVGIQNNSISDPPFPNPPPLRYWFGMPEVGVVPDPANPENPPLLIEGEEVFLGPRAGMGYVYLQPNEVRPDAPDQTIFPHFHVGPSPQSATAVFTYSSRQQIGNFLYATDTTNGVVHAINSNTMRVITSIQTPDPTGLAIAPDMSRIYVTNFDADTVSVISSNPLAPDFHREIARIRVGSGPRAICVQPEHEEIFVCNYLGNSVSLISEIDLSVRKTIDQLISAPYDVEATPRQIVPTSPSPLSPTMIGWACGLYFAYISNAEGNSVVVYESGPDGPQGIGIDNVRGSLPQDDDTGNELLSPRGLCYDPFPNPSGLYAGGVFVTHRDSDGHGRLSEIQFTVQSALGPLPISAPPGLQTPPGFLDRNFEIVRTWGNIDGKRLPGNSPVDVTLADLATAGYHTRPIQVVPNLGGPSTPPEPEHAGTFNSKHPMRLASPFCTPAHIPDRLYVAFDDIGTIQVLNPIDPIVVGPTINEPSVTGVRKLMSFWRQ